MHFFKKYIGIKIEDIKILVLISKLSPKLDEINAIIPINIIQSWEIFTYFINLPHNYALFQKIHKNQN